MDCNERTRLRNWSALILFWNYGLMDKYRDGDVGHGVLTVRHRDLIDFH